MSTILFALLIVAFFSGARLFAVMIFLCAIGAILSPRSFDAEFGGFMSEFLKMGTGDAATIFSTIPLFIYAGYLMAVSKTAERLVRFSNALLGWMPGGLGIVTILACAIYTTFTGASGVTIVALGSLLMPSLVKSRYPERFSLGLVTGTGSVGLLFPPALPLFIFGTVLGLQQELTKKWMAQNPEWEWATERFVWAGIVPGLVLVGSLSVVVIAIAIIKKVPRQKFDLQELFKSFIVAAPELALPFLIIAALATGLGDISQIASLTVMYLLVVEMLVYRDVKPIDLWNVTKESMALIGAIFIIVFASNAVTNYLVTADVPKMLVAWTRDHIGSREAFLLALNCLLILVGMMMDIFSAILIVLPLIAPIAYEYGVNPYHLGVIFLLNLEIGYLTPPVGLNLFISSFKFRKPVTEVVRSVLPFIATMIFALMLVTYIPSLTVVPPPKPRGTLDGLVQMVKASVDAVSNVKEITLPDGKIMKQTECNAITSDFERDNCLLLFSEITACRKKPEAEAKTCEETLIKEYLGEEDDGGDFEDDDGGSFEDEGAEEEDKETPP
jgi:C4-dicarboxylate transporter DctM subunit